MGDDYEFTIEGPDGTTDTLTVPANALKMLTEGNEPPAAVVGDLALLTIAQQLHGAVHHGRGEPDEELEQAEAEAMEAFEARFGASFGEVTGHSH